MESYRITVEDPVPDYGVITKRVILRWISLSPRFPLIASNLSVLNITKRRLARFSGTFSRNLLLAFRNDLTEGMDRRSTGSLPDRDRSGAFRGSLPV